MRPARIPPEVRPIGVGRIHEAGAVPGDRFTAGCDDGPYTWRHRIIRIDIDEVEVTLQRIALQSRGISVPCVEITDRSGADRSGLIGRDRWRRCIRRTIKENERRLQT